MFTRRHLDQLVLDVEFVLLAVVQGVALTALGIEAVPVLRNPEPTSCVMIATGLLFVLAFWAGALIHAVSIVRWPMDLPHYFFYFAIGLLEMVTFAQTHHPRGWFAASLAFYLVGGALYAYDLAMIRHRRAAFEGSDAGRRLYAHVLARQQLEMFVIMPAGLVFNFVAWWTLHGREDLALAFSVAQLLFTALFLVSLVRSFSQRMRLISACMDEDLQS